ncbi:alpha-1,2-fucosyltransferase [Flavobacterium frigoris]|nr:alpha-1,2-fucosyltransferase [Flavobacterium frigoris]
MSKKISGKKNKMIVVKLQGGLGNQMFQYAIASILALENKSKLKVDNLFFENKEKSIGFTPRQFELSVFNNKYLVATQKEIKAFTNLSKFNQVRHNYGLNYPKVFVETYLGYHNTVLQLKSPIYLDGYFQSYHYFEGYESFVKDLFSFSTMNLDEKNKKILTEINNSETVSVHIRRGDYVNDKLTQQFHGNCSKEYYLEAIHRMEQKSKGLTYVFFSDDIDWVKEEYANLLVKKLFVDENKGSESWKDMFLMTYCSHNIIANSSFSWWGAWLNSFSEKTVIAPKKWFLNTDANEKTKDLIPESWLRI